MSRWVETYENGKRIETIANMEQCKYLINEVCCNADSALVGDWPFAEDCKRCELFTKEDGAIEEDLDSG